jgi:hypothetical protein
MKVRGIVRLVSFHSCAECGIWANCAVDIDRKEMNVMFVLYIGHLPKKRDDHDHTGRDQVHDT